MDIVFLLLLFVAIAVGVAVRYWLEQRNMQRWRVFAEKHGFELEFSFQRPTMRGNYRGVPVQIILDERRIDRRKVNYTLIDAFLAHPPDLPGLHIYKEGFFSTFDNSLNQQNIEIGDAQFDQLATITCNKDKHAVRAYLNAPLRRAILALINKYPAAHFGQYGCHMEQRGFISNPAKLEQIFDLMTTCCTRGNVKTINDDDDDMD